MWGDQELTGVEEISVDYDIEEHRTLELVNQPITGEMTFKLNFDYFNYMWLAREIGKRNPKKGKWIAKIAEPLNPVRVILPQYVKK